MANATPTNTLKTLKTLKAGRLEIAYLEDGPRDGAPVLLLHGFPDDATGWLQVVDRLAGHGYRCYAPFVRGVGETRFLDPGTPRAGDFAALGQDAIDFVDRLDLQDLIVVGQDWGSPTAEIVAMERPDRLSKLVKLNWYGIYTMAEMAKAQGFAYPQLRALWYVWLFNTPLGNMVLEHDRGGLAEALWSEWSPSWDAGERTRALDRIKPSLNNPDFVRIVLSTYQADITAGSEQDPLDDDLRQRLKDPPPVACDTVVLTGADDGVEKTPLSEEAIGRYFSGQSSVRTLPGVGHFPQREAPEEVVAAITNR